MFQIRKILHPTDFSEQSQAAFDVACALARDHAAELITVHVSPPPAVYAPEPGRRFGIAIALFILLILFTLALSIVLRPRHRDAPVELSLRTSVPCQIETSSATPSCSAASTTASPIAS